MSYAFNQQYNRPLTPSSNPRPKPIEISRRGGAKIQFNKKARAQPVIIQTSKSTDFGTQPPPRSEPSNQNHMNPSVSLTLHQPTIPKVEPPPPQPTIPQIDPKPAQPDVFNRLSLLSFVSTFEDEKSFNETDLEALGLDLKCQEPLLPMLHSVLSDAPLLDHSKHPMPECYSKIQSGNPSEKLSLFSPQTLLFIFYTYPRDNLQVQAAQELEKRQWSFDEDSEKWRDQDGNPWSVDQWCEFDENQGNDLGDLNVFV